MSVFLVPVSLLDNYVDMKAGQEVYLFQSFFFSRTSNSMMSNIYCTAISVAIIREFYQYPAVSSDNIL